MNEEKIYSYHTFLFPFIWKTDSNIKMNEFLAVLNTGEKGTDADWVTFDWKQRLEIEGFLTDAWMQDYQAYQYFTAPANEMLFNCEGSNVVRCYYYNASFKDYSKYIITKGDKEYSLIINNIRLNIYEAGIAVLILEMENHSYPFLNDINCINEYGRRINLPFLVSGISHNLCADSIEIRFGDKNNTINGNENPFKMDFLQFSKNIQKTRNEKESEDVNDCIKTLTKKDISFTYIMKPLQSLLDGGGNRNNRTEITTHYQHKSNDSNKFYIKPCVDDRMFVCCLVVNNELSKEIKGIGHEGLSFLIGNEKRLMKFKKSKEELPNVFDAEGSKKDDYLEGWNDETTLASRIYKFLYIEKDLSCHENRMKERLLKESVYERWINTGTLTGITHHSLCCITNDSPEYYVVFPFLIEYVQMAVIALVQRSIILMLEDEVATISKKLCDDEGDIHQNSITDKDIGKIERLQAKYVMIQNQLLLSEITVQEQGVELYELFRKQLYIDKNLADLNLSMNNLRDVANITNARMERLSDSNNEMMTNILSIGLALMFFLEPLANLIAYLKYHDQVYDIGDKVGLFTGGIWCFTAIVSLIGLYVLYRHEKRKLK